MERGLTDIVEFDEITLLGKILLLGTTLSLAARLVNPEVTSLLAPIRI